MNSDGSPPLGARAPEIREAMRRKLAEHQHYIVEHGDDMPEVKDWKWTG